MSEQAANDWTKRFSARRLGASATTWFFVWLLSAGSLWSMLQPPFGVADETAHITKAVATASLQLSGDTVVGDFGFQATEYSVPSAYEQQIGYISCYVGNVAVSAACLGEFPNGRERVTIASTAGHYPPTYYLLVGIPGLACPGEAGIYLMRLISTLLFASMTAWAFSIARRRRSALCSVGVFAAVTPMSLAVAGAVNPHGLEIASAILFWVTSLSVFEDFHASRRVPREVIVALAVSSFVFATARPASFVWMLPTVVLALLFSGAITTLRRLTSFPQGRFVSALLGGSILLSVALHLKTGLGTKLGGGSEPGSDSIFANLEIAFERGDDYFRQMFGWFGWVEFYTPPFAFWSCILVLGLILGMMLVDASVRQWIVTVAALLTVWMLPFLLEGLRATGSGFGYQGRYTLALAVGIPILGAFSIPRDPRRAQLRNGTISVLAFTAFAVLVSIDFALRRYTVGLAGPHLWIRNPEWLPPGGLALIGLLGACALVGASMTGVCLIRPAPSDADADETPSGSSTESALAI